MTDSVTIHGLEEVEALLARYDMRTEVGVKRIVRHTAESIKNDAVRSINRGPKTGKQYKRGRNRVHTASKGGEAPATDYGFLANSIKAAILNQGMAAEVGTHIEYGRHLEEGTTRIRPRPWLNPALQKNVGTMMRAFRKMLEDETR